MKIQSLPANNPRRGFTLVEVLVSSFLTLVILGMLFSVLLGTLSAWEGGTSNLKSSGDARFALDLIKTDLESMVARQTSYNQEWLMTTPHDTLGDGSLFNSWLVFFSPSLDRDSGQEGDIVSVSYRVAYQDPISENSQIVEIFGLYKAMTTTMDAFNIVMDFPPRSLLHEDVSDPGYWTSSPDPAPDSRAGFIAPNVVDFKIAWWIRSPATGDLKRIDENHYVRLSNQLVVYDINGDPVPSVSGGKIESAEVSMTILTDEGMRRFAFFQEQGAGGQAGAQMNRLIDEFGTTHTMRIPIHY